MGALDDIFALMPELPEVETTRQGISSFCVSHSVQKLHLRRKSLRWPIPDNLPELIQNHTIKAIHRRSKYLLFEFDHGYMLMHLGMSGSLRILPHMLPPAKHDHVDLEFSHQGVLRFTDPRRFGAILWVENLATHKLLVGLGPEPLSSDFNIKMLQAKLKTSKRPIKLALMDAAVVVGVGNIYANEALFAARMHPQRAANSLNQAALEALVNAVKSILTRAIRFGGTTLKDFTNSDGKPGYFSQELLVYGRKGKACVNCQNILQEIRLSNRSTVFCSSCQVLS